MYSKRAGLVLGFHGCDKSVRDDVVYKKGILLNSSENDYDWLGSGVYFWENNYLRALDYAKQLQKHPGRNKKTLIKEPAVIGAVIDLGYCLDLLDSEYLKIVKESYKVLEYSSKQTGYKLPENISVDSSNELLKRYLDCAVINSIHTFNKKENKAEFDSVRGVFFEGNELYENAGFREKNHIQIAIRNPNCIKGYFIPREIDSKHKKP